MRLVFVLLALAACQEETNFPRVPGSGGGGAAGGGRGGGSGDEPDAAGLIGQVCLVDDLRRLDQCATSGAGNLTVTLGGESTTTESDGTFTITEPGGSFLVWRVSGTGFVTSVMAATGISVIPVITTLDYQALLDTNLVAVAPGQGSMVIGIVSNGLPVADATATTNPVAQFPTRYDSSSPLLWETDDTGPLGTMWIVGAGAGLSTVTVTPPNNGTEQSNDILVENASITYATFAL